MRALALDILVESAKFIGADIFDFTEQLSKYPYLKFKELTQEIFNLDQE